mmetsp:Transcript_26279/g.41688  ORF Transcript_26279/g.41688 Transcript_26279/m.41688 type:complete len:233 (+) Transcript_26279:91-789(+)
MAEYYSLLPQNAKGSQEIAQSEAKLSEMRQICENVELDQCNAKLNAEQINAYHFQLLVYLVQDELALAKYLVKRVPKEVREKDTFAAIWDVGCCMFKNEHISVYDKVKSGKWSPVFAPFLQSLEVNYRLKQVGLITNAYTSITIKELLESYLGLKDLKALSDFIETNKLKAMWSFDNTDKPTKVVITKPQQDYQELLGAQRLMAQFTKYVVFMESQQKLAIDEISAATQSNK